MRSKDCDDTRAIVEYTSECPIAPDGKHVWKMGEGGTGYKPALECAHCGSLTTQRRLLD